MNSNITNSSNIGDILVVEDNLSNLKLLTDILRKAGYQVRPAGDGELALRSVQAKLPTLIMLDIRMPDMDGYEVCRRLKESEYTREVPVVFISALAETINKVKAFGVGGIDYVTKPFEPEEVLARVRTHLTIRQMQLQLKEKNLQLQDASNQLENQVQQRTKELSKSKERYRSITDDVMDSSKVGIFILDKDFHVVWINKAIETYFGLKRDEVIGKDKRQLIKDRIHSIFEDGKSFQEIVFKTYDNNTFTENFVCHVLPENERKEKWLEHWSQPIKSGLYSGGRVEHYTDITEQKQAEHLINASLKEKEVLLKEIHHRVKNNMQVVSSLLKLQARSVKDKDTIDILEESQNRIKAMSMIHEKLYRSENLASINFGEYIKNLANDLFRSYRMSVARVALKMEVSDITIDIDSVVPCGLIVNELITNSLKYAFPDNKKGEIKISLHKNEDSEIEMVFSDNGIGLPEDIDYRNTDSMGLRLIFKMTEHQLGGKVELDRSNGTEFRICFKEEKYKKRM